MQTDNYEVWCEEVGIIPDSESREAWEHQQEKIDKLTKTLFMLQVGSCNCVTKTNDASYHADNCPYKMIVTTLNDVSGM